MPELHESTAMDTGTAEAPVDSPTAASGTTKEAEANVPTNGEPSQPNETTNSSALAKEKNSEEKIRMGKKVSRVVNTIEGEIEDLLEEYKKEIPATLKQQIETLRKLSDELKGSEAKANEDEEEWASTPVRVTMEEWRKDLSDKEAPKAVIKAFYHSLPSDQDGTSKTGSRKELPYRIAVTSTILDRELEQLGEISSEFFPMVQAAPYKLVTKFYPKMKERLAELRQQRDLMDDEKTSSSSTSSSKSKKGSAEESQHSPDDAVETKTITESSNNLEVKPIHRPHSSSTATELKEGRAKRKKEVATAISHLQQMHDFVETHLTYYLDLRARIKAGTITKIAFEDLWHLFEPGELLYAKETQEVGIEQLYRVYSVTGGLPRRGKMGGSGQPRDDEAMLRLWRQYLDSRGEDSDGEGQVDTRVEASGIGVWNPLTLDCYIMAYDGRRVGPVDVAKQIKHYSGERRITDLPVYPVRFHEQKDEIIARAVTRGRKYINSYGHKSYNDLTAPVTRHQFQEQITGDIFVDVQEYYRIHSDKKPRLGRLRKSRSDPAEVSEVLTNRRLLDHEIDDAVTDDYLAINRALLEPVDPELVKDSESHLILYPWYIPAYSFRARSYIHVKVNSIEEIDKSEQARDEGFDDLVIPESHRSILIPLVEQHSTGTGSNDSSLQEGGSTQIDIVRGKGRGLIILLHGPPGSGKTSTAETIAAYTRRALYALTCGDLGSSPENVEIALKKHADRAHRWGCVLLLDEADIFLSRRDARDTQRNALVSVFLRQLEYYSGILFLTTNRVGVIDEAFKSRIHVSLRYPRIELEETLAIWKNTLARIEVDNKTSEIQIKFDRESLLSFARKHYLQHEKAETTWNGRQIRNAFQTAIALGHYERDRELRDAGMRPEDAATSGQKKWMRVKLTTKSFGSIAKTAREFEDYLVVVRGQDAETARELQLRNDTHDMNAEWMRKDYTKAKTSRGVGTSSRIGGQNYTNSAQKRQAGENSGGNYGAARSGRRPRSDVEDDMDEGEDDILEENLSDDDD